jgi:Tol biopolymer transport system component
VQTEDAHRVACQQWLSGGRRVAFHEHIEKKWRVVVVDVETLEKTIVAGDRQVGFGRPEGDLLPMYGCHWNPGPNRDLYVWDAATGKISTRATIAEVEAKFGDWLAKEFAGKPCSIFFPVISPDLQRVFFKISAGNGGSDFMAKDASHRSGLVVYDFKKGACTWQRGQWGHPGWMPDSRHIFEVGNMMMDTDNPVFTYTKLKDVPNLRGSHPSVSPDGKLMVTDGMTEPIGGKPNEWGVLVADMRGEKWKLLHSFEQNRGAKSWRRSDPHPAFSADGKRIYYNTSDTEFTRLMVAEIK